MAENKPDTPNQRTEGVSDIKYVYRTCRDSIELARKIKKHANPSNPYAKYGVVFILHEPSPNDPSPQTVSIVIEDPLAEAFLRINNQPIKSIAVTYQEFLAKPPSRLSGSSSCYSLLFQTAPEHNGYSYYYLGSDGSVAKYDDRLGYGYSLSDEEGFPIEPGDWELIRTGSEVVLDRLKDVAKQEGIV